MIHIFLELHMNRPDKKHNSLINKPSWMANFSESSFPQICDLIVLLGRTILEVFLEG